MCNEHYQIAYLKQNMKCNRPTFLRITKPISLELKKALISPSHMYCTVVHIKRFNLRYATFLWTFYYNLKYKSKLNVYECSPIITHCDCFLCTINKTFF